MMRVCKTKACWSSKVYRLIIARWTYQTERNFKLINYDAQELFSLLSAVFNALSSLYWGIFGSRERQNSLWKWKLAIRKVRYIEKIYDFRWSKEKGNGLWFRRLRCSLYQGFAISRFYYCMMELFYENT